MKLRSAQACGPLRCVQPVCDDQSWIDRCCDGCTTCLRHLHVGHQLGPGAELSQRVTAEKASQIPRVGVALPTRGVSHGRSCSSRLNCSTRLSWRPTWSNMFCSISQQPDLVEKVFFHPFSRERPTCCRRVRPQPLTARSPVDLAQRWVPGRPAASSSRVRHQSRLTPREGPGCGRVWPPS